MHEPNDLYRRAMLAAMVAEHRRLSGVRDALLLAAAHLPRRVLILREPGQEPAPALRACSARTHC